MRLPFKAEPGYEWTLREPIVAAVKAEGAPQPDQEAGLEVWTFTPVRDGQQTKRRASSTPVPRTISSRQRSPCRTT